MGPDCAQSGGPNAGQLEHHPGSMYGTANTYIVYLHGDPAFRLWSATISTCRSQFDTAISVSDEQGNRVGFNNDGDFGASDTCSSGASFLALHHLAPGRYTIYVEAEGGNLDPFAADEYTISIECEHILCRHPHQCYLDSNDPGEPGDQGDQGATGESGDAALPAEPGLMGNKGEPGDPAIRGGPAAMVTRAQTDVTVRKARRVPQEPKAVKAPRALGATLTRALATRLAILPCKS